MKIKTKHQTLSDKAEGLLRGKTTAVNAYIKKKEKIQIKKLKMSTQDTG